MKNITILINGHPNSGKSTLRDRLSDMLGEHDFYIYDYDKNLQKVATSIGVKDRVGYRKYRLKKVVK